MKLSRVVALCFSFAAIATEARGTENNWTSTCAAQTCKAFPRVEKGQGFNLVAYRVGETRVLEVVTPLGINLQKGIVLVSDEKEAFVTKLLSCDLDGCRSYRELEGDFLSALKKGLKIDIVVQTSKSREIVSFPVSLLGFTDAIRVLDK